MDTKSKQAEATARSHSLNVLAKWGSIIAICISVLAFTLYVYNQTGFFCAAIVCVLSVSATALFVAASKHRITFAAVVLLIASALVIVFLPGFAHQSGWDPKTNLGFSLLLNFSLLCFTGAVVALLRNNIGNLSFIEEHDVFSSIALAIFLVSSALLKVKGVNNELAASLADLFLVLAGVLISAMLEKERSKRRHTKKSK